MFLKIDPNLDPQIVPEHERRRRIQEARDERLRVTAFFVVVYALVLFFIYTGVWS